MSIQENNTISQVAVRAMIDETLKSNNIPDNFIAPLSSNHNSIAIQIDDGWCKVQYTNEALTQLTGFSRESITKHNAICLLVGESQLEISKKESGITEHSGYLMERKDGQLIPVEILMVNIGDGNVLSAYLPLDHSQAAALWPGLDNKEYWHAKHCSGCEYPLTRIDYMIIAKLRLLSESEKIAVLGKVVPEITTAFNCQVS